MKKTALGFLFAGIFMAVLLFITSCSSSTRSSKSEQLKTDGETFFAETTMQLAAGDAITTTAAGMSSSNLNAKENPNKKIIKNASLDIEAKNVTEAYQKLLEYITAQGGYEFSQNLSNNSDYATINAVVKIPSDKLDAALKYAEECGKVINVNTYTNDITSEYTDTELRLENKRKALQKYYDFYAKATTMDELVAIQAQIDQLTADIESYEGLLKMWNSQIDESTITIFIKEASDPNKIPENIEWNSISLSTMGKLIRNGFFAVVNGIVAFIQWAVIIIASASPIIAIGAVVWFAAAKLLKSRRAKKKAGPAPVEKQQ
ncbi:MAG: DUF4349 domain-containing protein [Oscillospiraceae bacterium]|nr:DUF4349 domain-containing protein [Oscillospiraceae bacterium]